ncbi:E3 ubiquitin-protein ligase Tom1p [[Candida] anglica]|uniref:HECT-type E3 ubiquitin transferase n=1 Tax=[Candida] anglica TaxID=148631 RepID=A0ABP0EEN5_9ASCO
MIISKKKYLEKFDLTPKFIAYIEEVSDCPVESLPEVLSRYAANSWERPRGDLNHWVTVLNRFDSLFESCIAKYHLDDEFPSLVAISSSDRRLLISCLQFTTLLLEHCTSRLIYNSAERLYCLINTVDVDLRLAALETCAAMAERFDLPPPSKYRAPKAVRMKVLKIAKMYPPLVPITFIQREVSRKDSEEEKKNSGEHFSLLDSITGKKYPGKWRSINFQYFKSEDELETEKSNKKKKKSKSSDKSETKSKSKSDNSKSKPTDSDELSSSSLSSSSSGLTTFYLSESNVKSMSLSQIYSKGSSVIPPHLWFEFALHAQIAKSFSTKSPESMDLRCKLLRMKCLSVAFIRCMCSTDFTSSHLFESQPFVFSFLVDLISPEHSTKVPHEVYLAAVKALECISLKRGIWGSDLIRCLGGNVNHGVLFQCIRHINRKVVQEDPQCFEKGYIQFFNMLGNLIETRALVPRLTSAGLLKELMSFFNVKSKFRWLTSAAVHLTDLLFYSSQESLDEFINENGFKLLIETIQYEVNFALENPDFGGGAPKDAATVYYTITFRQQNYIRNLMKLVCHLINADIGDRIRNLFDSPLLHCFNQILLHPQVFGPLILASTIDSVSYIIHNEPTAFSILNEARVFDTILDNFETLMQLSDLLMSLTEVLSAICLNKEGLQKVIDKQTIPSFFKSFYNVSIAKELVKTDMTINIGCSIDELGRHYPVLKPIILKEIQNLVKQFPSFANSQLKDGIQFYKSTEQENGSLYHAPEDKIIENEPNSSEIDNWDTSDSAYLVDNVCFFFGGLLQDSGQWGNDSINTIKYEDWAALLTLDNAPYDYLTANGLSSFIGVLKYFDDENRDYGLPVLFKMIIDQINLPLVQTFIHHDSTSHSFFDQYDGDEESGTILLKQLNVLCVMLYTLTDIYIQPGLMFNERYHQVSQLFGSDEGISLLEDFSKLLQRCALEEIFIKWNLPDQVAAQTSPVTGKTISDFPPIQIYKSEPSSTPPKQDYTSAKFKNTLQLRFFMLRFQTYVTTVFTSVARVAMFKRQDFVSFEWRRNAVKITLKLGELFAELIDLSLPSDSQNHAYQLTMTNVVLYCLSQKERGKDVVQTTLVMALLQAGYFPKLGKIVKYDFTNLIRMSKEDVDPAKKLTYVSTSEASLQRNLLSQALMIYSKIVNADCLPSLPSAKLFFFQGYDGAADSNLVPSLLVQTRLCAFRLIGQIMDPSGDVVSDDWVNEDGVRQMVANHANIPSSVAEQLVTINNHCWSARKENLSVKYTPLTVNGVIPPLSQINQLMNSGMNRTQAEHFFKHAKDLSGIKNRNWPGCPEMGISDEKWEEIANSINAGSVDDSDDMSSGDRSSNAFVSDPKMLEQLRQKNFREITARWTNFVQFFPSSVPSVATFLVGMVSKPKEVLQEVYSTILEVAADKPDRLAAVYHLFCLLVKSWEDVPVFEKFTQHMISQLESQPQNFEGVGTTSATSYDWFAYGLSVLEQFVCYKTYPSADPDSMNILNKQILDSKVFTMTDDQNQRLLAGLLQLKDISNVKTAIAVARLLVLYSREYSQAVQISSSPLTRELIQSVQRFVKENESYSMLQTTLIVLCRRCFETTEVLQMNMIAELPGYFKALYGETGLYSVLNETASLALREPNVYLDTMSKEVIMDGYDGGTIDDISMIQLSLKKKDKERDAAQAAGTSSSISEDVEMLDAGLGPSPVGTGLMHILVNELMKVSKNDWVSDPKVDEESGPATPEALASASAVFKNPHFAYACFLLQTITELLASYKQSKFEFITFSKKKVSNEHLKPRPTALNFIIHQLIPTQPLEHKKGPENDRKSAIASLAKLAVLALVSTPVLDEKNSPVATKEDPDMMYIRKFYVDILSKILRETSDSTQQPITVRYSKLMDLCELCGALISPKFRDLFGPVLNKSATKYDTYYLARSMIDKSIPQQIGGIVAELDLNFPEVNRVVKLCLRPLSFLGKIKQELQEEFEEEHQGERDEDDDVLVDEEDRDETPDLFRNSTLGMYDADSEDEDEDDEFYDDEGPLEVLMEDEVVGDEDDDDDDDEDDDDDDDDEDDEDDEDDDSDEDMDDMDEDEAIELLGEIDIDRERGAGGSRVGSRRGSMIVEDLSDDYSDEFSDDYDEEEGSGDSIYDFDDDESVSEYSDAELDGWIEAFEDGEDDQHAGVSGNRSAGGVGGVGGDDDDDAPGGDADNLHVSVSGPFFNSSGHTHRDDDVTGGHESSDDGDDADGDEADALGGSDDDESGTWDEVAGGFSDSRRRARDFANTFFDALRPAMGGAGVGPAVIGGGGVSGGQPNIASIFGGLFSGTNGTGATNGMRGRIQVGGPGGPMGGRGRVDYVTRFVDSVLGVGANKRMDNDSNSDPLSNMYIKSTKERWIDGLKMYQDSMKKEFTIRLIPGIVNRTADESFAIYQLKKEKEQALKKEQEERMKKRQEIERIRKEEEAKERELQAANEPPVTSEPVMVRIGDREVDISGTDIDPEFFEALPDDMREEVFTQHVRERRANATSSGGENTREIDPDFLDALPEQIREEILQQESMARRFSEMGGDLEGDYDDEDDDEEDGDDDEDDDDEAIEDDEEDDLAVRSMEGIDMSAATAGTTLAARRRSSTHRRSSVSLKKKPKKTFFTPLVEKSGVAALIRLLFIPQPMNQRDTIHHALEYLCHSKQSRAEVMGLLISILQDGLANQKAMERSFCQITVRARRQETSSSQQSKKELATQFPLGGTPSVIGCQIIEAVHHLLMQNVHMRYYLLTEHENVVKKKDVATKESKYPINHLLSLLNNQLVRDEQPFMDVLAMVLQIATRPLNLLNKSRAADSDAKSRPPLTPPEIPEKNLRQLIKILISNDCPKATFRTTISAMQNLSVLDGAQKVFSVELSDQATSLGKTLIGELTTLTREISSDKTYDTEASSFAKFSASSSDQAKLLRILTALDYMFEKKEQQEDHVTDEIEELTGLYKKLALGTLWDALSELLRVLDEKQEVTNIATALLPLIEALMVVCKHSKVKEIQIKDVLKYESKRIDFAKEPIESLFFSFTDEHKKILNSMVRTNPNLMSGPFGMLVRNPRVLEFDNKKNYFDRMLHVSKNEQQKLSVSVSRDQVFLDSYRALFFKPQEEFRNSKLEITFKGEAGVDAGGVTREWYQVLSRQMFNPDYALFTPVASDETTFHPNRTSFVNPEHLSFFKFIGRIIGKAIFDGSFLDCHFSRAVYKRILSRPVSLKDMETLDLEYFKSLMWMLENDITDVITEDFSVETDDYGEHKVIELIPNGANIPVTEENKQEYVKQVVEYRLQTSVTEQMDNFLMGFHEIIPKDLVAIFDEQELELLISGLPDIDVNDWKNNSTYMNYSPSSPQIQWFWRAVKSFDTEERAKLLQFATGTSKVPLNGFKELSGANGTCKFSIHRDYGATDRLPSSHTCFNQIDLPAYETYDELRGSLLLALTEGHEGFGLA